MQIGDNMAKAFKWVAGSVVLLAVLWLSGFVHVVNYDGTEEPDSPYGYDDYYGIYRASAWGGMVSNSLTVCPVWEKGAELHGQEYRRFIYFGSVRGYRMTEWTWVSDAEKDRKRHLIGDELRWLRVVVGL